MLKDELIARLQQIPGNPEVCIFDIKRNLADDTGEGSSAGLYPNIEISVHDRATSRVGDECGPWIGLGFDNLFFPEEEGENDY
jgi:hypothetical protein